MDEACEPLEGIQRLARDNPDGLALADVNSSVSYGELLPWVCSVAESAINSQKGLDHPTHLPLPVNR